MNYDNIDITKDTCDVSFNCSSKFLILMKILRNFRQLLTMTTTPMTFISNFIPNSEKLFNKRFKLLTISHHLIYFSFQVQLYFLELILTKVHEYQECEDHHQCNINALYEAQHRYSGHSVLILIMTNHNAMTMMKVYHEPIVWVREATNKNKE